MNKRCLLNMTKFLEFWCYFGVLREKNTFANLFHVRKVLQMQQILTHYFIQTFAAF